MEEEGNRLKSYCVEWYTTAETYHTFFSRLLQQCDRVGLGLLYFILRLNYPQLTISPMLQTPLFRDTLTTFISHIEQMNDLQCILFKVMYNILTLVMISTI